MATAEVATMNQSSDSKNKQQQGWSSTSGEGLKQYYMQHIHDNKTHMLNRLEAHRNQLNSQVRMLKEQLELLQEPGSDVGEVVKVMGKSKVLVKVRAAVVP